jgi:type I restriction enzyme S subunit
MKRWPSEKAQSLVTFRTGKLDSNAAEPNGEYPFFTCAQETYRINKYAFDTECVLLAGNNAAGIFPLKYYNGKFNAYQRTYIIEPKETNKINTRYIYESFKLFLKSFEQTSTGATTKFLTMGILNNLWISTPPLPIQRKIAAVLSAYDDLIENNNRRIAILEKMAEELYREWFVRLRFPGHENTKIVKGVPEGWGVKRVEELIVRIPVGKKYDDKSVVEKGNVPVLDQGQSGIIGYHNETPGVVATLEDPIIVFANHTCYKRIIFYPFSAIQNVLPFKTNPNIKSNIYWLQYSTNNLVELSEYRGHWPTFINSKIYYPGYNLANAFGDLIKPKLHTIYYLNLLNTKLSNSRDRLLSRLMSGKIDLEKLDILFPKSMQEELVKTEANV